jgi:hypothetical protein
MSPQRESLRRLITTDEKYLPRPPFYSFTRTARMMPLMRPQTVTFWAITLPSIVEVTAGHLCRLARRLAGRCRHRGPLRTRQAAHRPLHWQARPRIGLRRGRLPRCPADLGVLVLRNAGWQRLFKPVFALSPAARICLSGMLIGIGGIAFYAWHVGESTAQSLVHRMHRCATVLDDTARLFCYESLGSRQPAKGANAPAIPMGAR